MESLCNIRFGHHALGIELEGVEDEGAAQEVVADDDTALTQSHFGDERIRRTQVAGGDLVGRHPRHSIHDTGERSGCGGRKSVADTYWRQVDSLGSSRFKFEIATRVLPGSYSPKNHCRAGRSAYGRSACSARKTRSRWKNKPTTAMTASTAKT
jgi:hypothetical protein